MKFIKKYGLYICLAAMIAALGTVSYFAERKSIMEESTVETSYTPVAVKDEKPKEEVQKAETAAKAEPQPKPQPAEESVPLAFSSPIAAGASVGYSGDELVYSETMKDYRTHSGIDYSADEGTDVVSAAYGTVADVSNDTYFGLTVTVDHGGGLSSVYSSLGECFVNVGDKVERGGRIGTVGNSAAAESAEGAHLHFEAIKDGKTINPIELMN